MPKVEDHGDQLRETFHYISDTVHLCQSHTSRNGNGTLDKGSDNPELTCCAN